MDALVLKTEALCWLRFGKQLPYVATEVAYHRNEDVLGMNEEFSIEVEVKVSVADLKREFKTKTGKHYLYAHAAEGPARGAPNYFYFYVPQAIADKAVEIVKQEAPKAGVAVYNEETRERDGKKTYVAHKPTKLHDGKPTQHTLKVLLMRMGSELCGRYVAWREFTDRVHEALKTADDHVVEQTKALAQTPDWEKEDDGNRTTGTPS